MNFWAQGYKSLFKREKGWFYFVKQYLISICGLSSLKLFIENCQLFKLHGFILLSVCLLSHAWQFYRHQKCPFLVKHFHTMGLIWFPAWTNGQIVVWSIKYEVCEELSIDKFQNQTFLMLLKHINYHQHPSMTHNKCVTLRYEKDSTQQTWSSNST